MIRIDQLKIKIDKNAHSPNSRDICDDAEAFTDIKAAAANKLGILVSDIIDIKILRRSIDARKKPELFYVYSVVLSISESVKLSKKIYKDADVSDYEPVIYGLPDCGDEALKSRPVIVGSGPSGLFCAYELAKAGFNPLVIERGKSVDDRKKDIEEYWKTGVLDTESNVQFGEGGAGTFSDGKLSTTIKDKSGRIGEALKIFADHGAPSRILYDHLPHIGTDLLCDVIKNLRQDIISMGGEFRFETCLKKVRISDGRIAGCQVSSIMGETYVIDCSILVLATGHSARDTVRMLFDEGVSLSPKPFAAGFRVIHPQSLIDKTQYGDREYASILGASPYKLTAEFNGRGVFSFCMCPGGYVVNSSSEQGGTVVNGMSYSDRASGYANSAIVVSVPVSEYEGNHPLAGLKYQEELENRAFNLAKGKIPVQTYCDFAASKESGIETSDCFDKINPAHALKGQFEYSDLSGIFNRDTNDIFIKGIERFGKIIPGFNSGNMLMAGVESRTSSPVRIDRDENMNSSIMGLMPVGEGAGYAGGITSAAVDGIRAAEKIISNYFPKK